MFEFAQVSRPVGTGRKARGGESLRDDQIADGPKRPGHVFEVVGRRHRGAKAFFDVLKEMPVLEHEILEGSERSIPLKLIRAVRDYSRHCISRPEF